MSVILVEGGRKLSGAVTVQGAKNSVLPMLAATVLCPGVCCLRGCPTLSDVDTAVQIIRHLGGTVHREGPDLVVDTRQITGCEIPEELMGRMRSSVMFLGAILGRCGEAVCSQPGGCDLGPRPIDLHLYALRAMGAEIEEKSGRLRRLRHDGHIQRRPGTGNHGAAGLSKGHGCMRPGSRQRHRGGGGTEKAPRLHPSGASGPHCGGYISVRSSRCGRLCIPAPGGLSPPGSGAVHPAEKRLRDLQRRRGHLSEKRRPIAGSTAGANLALSGLSHR